MPRALLPEGKIEHVKVALSIDELGVPNDCKAAKGESNSKLVEVVCPAVLTNLRLTPAHDEAKTNVPSVQNATVSVSPR